MPGEHCLLPPSNLSLSAWLFLALIFQYHFFMETLDLPRLEQGGRLTQLNICFDGSRYSRRFMLVSLETGETGLPESLGFH